MEKETLYFEANYGYWDLTKYPYGGDFKRFDGTESGEFTDGLVKVAGEIRVKLSDGRIIITIAQAVRGLPFDAVCNKYEMFKASQKPKRPRW